LTKSCNEKNRKKSLYCIDKLYVQIGHELLRIEGIQTIFYYTNYETKLVNKPILWKNKDTVKYFDQFEIKKVNNIQEVKKSFFGYLKILCLTQIIIFKITTNFGMKIRLGSYLSNSVYIIWGFQFVPSKSEFNSTDGIFGTWNNKKTDDLKYLRNSSTIAQNPIEFYNSFEYKYLNDFLCL